MPGIDSFTSALIYALERLVEESKDGRFTTIELLNKIKIDAPHFPKDQTPMLVDREKKPSAGRIMLHPLRKRGSNDELSQKEVAILDPFKAETLTLHFDFSTKPSQTYIEMFGRGLNEYFERDVNINQVRWGGMKPFMAARAAKLFRAPLIRRKRTASMRLQQASASVGSSDTKLTESGPDPLTPSSSDQHSPQLLEPEANSSLDFNSAYISAMSLSRPLDSNDEREEYVQDHRGRHKRRRSVPNSESPA